MIAKTKYRPIPITGSLYQLGTPSFPAYLSLGDSGLIIEGGTGATFNIIVQQINELGIALERIQYLVLTHTHADHIGAVPHLKTLLPHLKILASERGARSLRNERVIKDFLSMDRTLTEIMLSKGEVGEVPPQIENFVFEVDRIVKEGDRIDLGAGKVWTVYDTPGHPPCHMALYDEGEETLVIGDATGFYVPAKDTFWPNYFYSLEDYCHSIRKLYALSARRGALSHNYVVDDVSAYLKKAMRATEAYHREMLERLGKGEDPEELAMEKARWVNTLTDAHPFEIMYQLAKVLINRSQAEAGKDNLFRL